MSKRPTNDQIDAMRTELEVTKRALKETLDLKRHISKTRYARWRLERAMIMTAINETMDSVRRARDCAQFCPGDLAGIQKFADIAVEMTVQLRDVIGRMKLGEE